MKKLPLWAIGATIILTATWYWYKRKGSPAGLVFGKLPGTGAPGYYVPNASMGQAAAQTLNTVSQPAGTAYYRAGQDSPDGSGGGNMS